MSRVMVMDGDRMGGLFGALLALAATTRIRDVPVCREPEPEAEVAASIPPTRQLRRQADRRDRKKGRR